MIKNEFVKKLISSACYCMAFFLSLMTLSLVDVCGAESGKKVESDQPFLFENMLKDVPDGLVEQIKLYWKYKGAKQFESAYTIEAPHTKYQLSLENYISYHTKARKLKGCRILNVEKSGELYFVRTEILLDDKDKSIRLKTSSKTQILNERWIRLENKWYHVYVHPFADIR
ncbi:MAG: hypothetical protein HQK69_09940 [Desulfamplus sp.]|nr:hypothetical protein [Desulfamplus sp.]